jgi:hypothetical protein
MLLALADRRRAVADPQRRGERDRPQGRGERDMRYLISFVRSRDDSAG